MATTENFSSKPDGTAIALTIAGSDSGGGAGIQADLKTFSALGVFGCSVIASLTAQNTRGVQGVYPIPASFVAEQITSVLSDIPVRAVKTGMLATADIIATVEDSLAAWPRLPLIVDPVMVATSGDRLLAEEAVEQMRKLLARATLITPNLPETAALLNEPVASGRDAMRRQAEALLKFGVKAVLLKGGHDVREPEASDLLLTATGEELWLSKPRLHTVNTHGTGCTLASAITAGLARGLPLTDAVRQAKEYIHEAIRHSDALTIGQGAGPVHHFYQFY